MKNLRQDVGDSIRPEYTRADFSNMVIGKHAATQLEFAELVHLLLTCIGEEEGITFVHHSPGNYLADHRPGDWTYEFDNANQITLRYWISEFGNIEEAVSNPPCVTSAQERAHLQNLLVNHVRNLKTLVGKL